MTLQFSFSLEELTILRVSSFRPLSCLYILNVKLFQEKREELRIRRNVYTLSTRPRRQVPSMLRQESRVKLRRDSAVSSNLGKVREILSFLVIEKLYISLNFI